MTIMVTGGAGFIGSNLVKNLLETTDHEVVVVDRNAVNIGRLEKLTSDCREFTVVHECYNNVAGSIIGEHEPETVVHLAAVPRVAFSVEHPSSTTYENTYLTTKLLSKCKDSNCVKRFVFASSSSVYGGAKVLPTPETHPLDPKSPYALQKKTCEEYCKMFSSLYDLDTVCLRFFNVFGPEQYVDSPYATVISNWFNCLKNGKPLLLEDDGQQSRDFSYVDNVTEAIKCVSFADEKFNGDVFNVGNNKQTSLNDILDWLYKEGYRYEVEDLPARLGDVKHTRADISKLQKLGYSPVCDVWEGMKRTDKWWFG